MTLETEKREREKKAFNNVCSEWNKQFQISFKQKQCTAIVQVISQLSSIILHIC